jgi:hypothetical protein
MASASPRHRQVRFWLLGGGASLLVVAAAAVVAVMMTSQEGDKGEAKGAEAMGVVVLGEGGGMGQLAEVVGALGGATDDAGEEWVMGDDDDGGDQPCGQITADG